MKYIVTLNGKQYEVEVEKGQATASLVGNAPTPVPAPAAAPSAPSSAPLADSDQNICAPMPGTILAVKCSPGQSVTRGDILFVLEAMKMENEIFAPHDGIVSAVLITQGATVDTGTVLCTM